MLSAVLASPRMPMPKGQVWRAQVRVWIVPGIVRRRAGGPEADVGDLFAMTEQIIGVPVSLGIMGNIVEGKFGSCFYAEIKGI